MTEVSTDLRNIFFHKIPPILKLEVGFFSDKKSFSQIFQNTANFFYLNLISKKTPKKSENIFGEGSRAGGRSLLTLLESSGKPTATINSARVYRS